MKEPHRPCRSVGSHCRSPARRQLKLPVNGIAVACSSIKTQFQTRGRGQTQPPPPHSPETARGTWSVEVNCRKKVDHLRHRVLYAGFVCHSRLRGWSASEAVIVRRCDVHLIGLGLFPRSFSESPSGPSGSFLSALLLPYELPFTAKRGVRDRGNSSRTLIG